MRNLAAAASVAACVGVFVVIAFPQPQTRRSQSRPPEADLTSFRVVFGYQRTAVKSYGGSITVTGGMLRTIEPWRFQPDDAITGPNSWKLQTKRTVFENQPDQPQALSGGPATQNLVPAGLIVTVDSTTVSAQLNTQQGNFSIPIGDLAYGRELWFLDHDVVVERVPTPQRVSPQNAEQHDYPSITVTRSGEVWSAWQAYQDRGDHVYARRQGDDPVRLTTQKGDVFRTSVAEDAAGQIHVAWSERQGQAWNLYERVFDGRTWSPQTQITRGTIPNVFHKLIPGKRGLALIWVGHENGESFLYLATHARSGGWSQPQRIGGPNVWSPDAAVDGDDNLHVAWDSYQNGNYDIFYRRIASDGAPGPIEQITKSPAFHAHPSLAIDGQGRPWLAWDQSGANWGKDWTREDQYRSTVLYKDRSIHAVVKDGGQWKQAPDFAAAVPDRLKRYWQLPHLASDGAGRIWAMFQMQTSVAVQRADYWASGAVWDFYLTTIDNGVWRPAAFVPHSSGRNEAAFQTASAADGVWLTWATDTRDLLGLAGNPFSPTMLRYEVFAARASTAPASGAPVFSAFNESGGQAQIMHPNERDDIRRIRAYRTTVAGAEYRILRGDFHRHTDISNDGAGDGSLEDYYRYNLDAAAMDTGIVTDHNMGGDAEYNWWRTEKSYDLFLIPNRYTPLFGYERSVNYPNGHRNVVFDHRGVRTLPVSTAENQGQVNSGSLVYPYLRQNRGICMEHSLATGQGTDWRDNDPDLEPLVELYQGYHAAYEYEGAPRAESANNHLLVHGAYEPAGFYWNALAKGYKLGVQASSDHISTHSSYAMIYTPTTNRTDIVESMRKRHAYAATDNIILDFEAVDTDGSAHLMGDIFTASRGLKLRVKVDGTDLVTRVDVIRNNAIVYSAPDQGTKSLNFEYVDREPQPGTNWYYIRVTQIDRNLAWSSPVWVTYR